MPHLNFAFIVPTRYLQYHTTVLRSAPGPKPSIDVLQERLMRSRRIFRPPLATVVKQQGWKASREATIYVT